MSPQRYSQRVGQFQGNKSDIEGIGGARNMR